MNSAAALPGTYAWWDHIPGALPGWLIAVAVGGSLGAFIGSRYLPELRLSIILAAILLASGGEAAVWATASLRTSGRSAEVCAA